MEKQECCGKTLEFNYCPICGKRVEPKESLATLLTHCRQAHKARETEVENLELRLVESQQRKFNDSQKQIKKFLRSAKIAEAKWKVWLGLMEEVCRNRGNEEQALEAAHKRGYDEGHDEGHEFGIGEDS